MRIRTGWSRPLLTVTANGPLAADRITNDGASMRIRSRRAVSHASWSVALTWAVTGSSRCW